MLFSKPRQAPRSPSETGTLARGAKTLIRPFERADVDRWIEWPRHGDPLFDSYNPPLLTPRQRDLYYQQRRNDPTSRQFAVESEDGAFVGRISLREIDWDLRTAVLGITFHPGRLGEGYGSDALWAFLRYYFQDLEMQVLFLDVAAFNRRAYRVYEKCGFEPIGQRWGDAQTDMAGIFRRPEYAPIRPLFRWDYGLVRPLVIDMRLSRADWERIVASRQQGDTTDVRE